MKKFLLFLVAIVCVLLLIYLLGPRVHYDKIDLRITPLNKNIEELDSYIAEKESKVKNLKKDNESRIIWVGEQNQVTEYAVVYLHGFSASPMESKPIHLEFAKRFNCNMYLPRLAGHGLDNVESFVDIQPADWINSAKEAIAIGNIIGNKIILMSCSSGSTLAVPLAAENPDLVEAQIMLSPNLGIDDPKAKLLTGPWGKQIARKVQGSDYRNLGLPKACHQYWTMRYRINGVFAVQGMIDQGIKEMYFEKLTHPIFMGFYYKNENESDHVISTDAIREYFKLLPGSSNIIREFKNVDAHVIASECQSKDLDAVRQALWQFGEEQIGMN